MQEVPALPQLGCEVPSAVVNWWHLIHIVHMGYYVQQLQQNVQDTAIVWYGIDTCRLKIFQGLTMLVAEFEG